MTVHAAKGLEFPIVIVPHLSGMINVGARDALWIDPDFGLAIKIADPDNNFDLQPTRLRAILKNYQSAKIFAEEKRLLYVAFTRAQQHLIISASQRSKPRASDNKMNWLLDALEITDDELAQPFFQFSEKLYPSDDSPTTFRIPIITDLEQLPLPPELTAPAADNVQPLYNRLEQISNLTSIPQPAPEILNEPIFPQPPAEIVPTTELQNAALCPARPFFEKNLPLAFPELTPTTEDKPPLPHQRPFAMIRGSLIHRAIELSSTPAAKDRKNFAQNIVDSETLDLDQKTRNNLIHDVLDSLEKFEKSAITHTINNAKTVLRELPFRLEINSAFISGKIDCLAQTSSSHWLVLDFKTDRIEAPDIEAHSQNYSIQMSTYAIFAASLLSPNAHPNITAALYYTEPDSLYEIHFDRQRLELARNQIHTLFHQTVKFRQQSRTFKSLPLRSSLQHILQWCEQCPSRDKPHCARKQISLLLEQLK
jgi:ATP-dependent helicase/nuclease subunit A